MNFNSPEFLLFLPTVLILYWVIPHRFRWALLLAASYYFYAAQEPFLIFLILSTTLVSYSLARLMEKTERKGIKKLYMWLAVIFCLGMLVFFKYADFLISNVTAFLNMFKADLGTFSLGLLLPVGISFYTFQTLSYVIDVYKGKVKAEKHLGYYALYICFFPQLVAGPIERPGDLLPQLRQEQRLNLTDLSCGFRIMLVGFFYKCVVADFFSTFVNNVFNGADKANGLSVFIAGFLFTIQMYCDFAGYSEIAAGVARMMGIRLSRNFNKPFISVSYSDFFRRWHITLTRWFTDYVYIPLGGNRKGTFRRILNTFIVFMLCGLWHGANWTYLCWGLYAATFLNIETLLKKPVGSLLRKLNINPDEGLCYGLRVVGMYFILIPAAIIFRSNDLSHAGALLTKLFTGWNAGSGFFEAAMSSLKLTAPLILELTVFAICEVLLDDHALMLRNNCESALPEGPAGDSVIAGRFITAVYMVIIIALCWIGLIASGGMSAFQYFRF